MTTPPAGQDPFLAAVAAYDAGDLARAETLSREMLYQNPDHPKALALLGLIAHRAGQHGPAVYLTRRAIHLEPNIPAYHANLAAALLAQGRIDEATAAANVALQLKPDFIPAMENLGQAKLATRDFAGAIETFERALRVRPDAVVALNNLGHALRSIGRLDEAIATLSRAIALAPNLAESYANLGNALRDQARYDEALAAYRRATALQPDNPSFASNLLYAMWFHPRLPADEIDAAYHDWNRRFAAPLRDPRPFENHRDPDRRLRIGYVSPDFRDHVIGRYIEPLIANHDRGQFEIFCYADVAAPDALTARFEALADGWRSIAGVGDAQVAEEIRADCIDILIDLTNHLANNRLLVFARKPVPVQLTYLAHPATTGLEAIDYRITDPFLDPPTGSSAIEQPLVLPQTYLVYPPPTETIDVEPPSSLKNGYVTFISPNAFAKLNDDVLDAWTAILKATPNTRLLVRLDGGAENNAHVPGWFADHGIDPARVEFLPGLPRADYLRLFNRADISLDPFPYAGYTTTLDAAWMGVPTVTLAGQTPVGRAGVSVLSNLKLPELIATSVEDYVRIAIALAADNRRLATLRSEMRDRMRHSPLLDHEKFARNIESAYRSAWRRWVAGG